MRIMQKRRSHHKYLPREWHGRSPLLLFQHRPGSLCLQGQHLNHPSSLRSHTHLPCLQGSCSSQVSLGYQLRFRRQTSLLCRCDFLRTPPSSHVHSSLPTCSSLLSQTSLIMMILTHVFWNSAELLALRRHCGSPLSRKSRPYPNV